MKPITLRQYIGCLNKLARHRPHLMNLPMVYAVDEEGNAFFPVFNTPSVGHYDPSCNEFSAEDEDNQPNAVCVN